MIPHATAASDRYFWAVRSAGRPGPVYTTYQTLPEVDGISVYTDGTRLLWQAQGRNVYLEPPAQPTLLAQLVRLTIRVPAPIPPRRTSRPRRSIATPSPLRPRLRRPPPLRNLRPLPRPERRRPTFEAPNTARRMLYAADGPKKQATSGMELIGHYSSRERFSHRAPSAPSFGVGEKVRRRLRWGARPAAASAWNENRSLCNQRRVIRSDQRRPENGPDSVH